MFFIDKDKPGTELVASPTPITPQVPAPMNSYQQQHNYSSSYTCTHQQINGTYIKNNFKQSSKFDNFYNPLSFEESKVSPQELDYKIEDIYEKAIYDSDGEDINPNSNTP